MPLTTKGEQILSAMEKEYGEKKGEEVFYASRNAGKISGVDARKDEEFITIEPHPGEFITEPLEDSGGSAKTELDVARAMRDGQVSSPQSFATISLFDVRITGTGTSYREARNEFVYRPPENYLTDEFLARCNGLPVIFEHPDGVLDTEEYRNRAVGTILLPYIKGEEVWGIARIYDDEAAGLMKTTHASTSPAVVFRRMDGNQTVELPGGEHLLIEGIPSYLDHLAICKEGVWDKGMGPRGINNGDNKMTKEEEEKKVREEEEKKDSAKKDEDAPAWADRLDKKLDSLCSRMDAYDKKDATKKDESGSEAHKKEGEDLKKAEEEHKKEDARRHDEEKEKVEKEKREEDARRHDSVLKENAQLRERIASVESGMKKMASDLSPDDREKLARIQMRADSLGRSLNIQVTPPHPGESPDSYERRTVAKFQSFAARDDLKTMKFDAIPKEAFAFIADQIYADAAVAARTPGVSKGAGLWYEKRNEVGREIMIPHGDSGDWIYPMTSPGYKLKGTFKTKFDK